MPCRDYEDDNRGSFSNARINELEAQNDKLARIACDALTRLYATKNAFVLNEETQIWWAAHQIADRKEQERLAQIKEHNKQVAIRAEKRRNMIAKMSKEQREILGL